MPSQQEADDIRSSPSIQWNTKQLEQRMRKCAEQDDLSDLLLRDERKVQRRMCGVCFSPFDNRKYVFIFVIDA